MTHSCARTIICKPLFSQNCLTRSGPNVTKPGPLAFGRKPSTESFSVGSDQSKSMSSNPPDSIEHGRSSWSICSMVSIERPMPPCMQHTLSSMTAANGSHSKSALNLRQACSPTRSPSRSTHSMRKPNNALISASSWFPLSKCTFSGCSIFNANNNAMVSNECAPRST